MINYLIDSSTLSSVTVFFSPFQPKKINQCDNLLCFVGNVGIKLSGVGAGYLSSKDKGVEWG